MNEMIPRCLFFLFACLVLTFRTESVYAIREIDGTLIAAANTPPAKKTEAPSTATPPKYVPPPKIKIPQGEVQTIEVDFMSPGIVAVQGGQWLGNEHLLGVSPHIGVVVELVIPPGVQFPIPESKIRDQVARVLKAGGVTPKREFYGVTPLPFLHIMIMLNPIEKGYAVFIAERLFEEVQLNRIRLKMGTTFQAITWEKQELVVVPKEQLQPEIMKLLESIANEFVVRFKAYSELKARLN
jgi:hypothetical protein